MKLVLALDEVAPLQNRHAVSRGDLKDAAVDRDSLLLKIADLRSQSSLPGARCTDQTTKIDLKLVYLPANEVFRKGHIFIDDPGGKVLGVQMEIGVE